MARLRSHLTLVPRDGTVTDASRTELDGVASMLPGRSALLDHLAEEAPEDGGPPRTLVLVGLTARLDGSPPPDHVLDRAAGVLSASLRGSDWLGRSAPGEFVAVITGTVEEAEVAALRLVEEIADSGYSAISASAGVAGLSAGVVPTEVLRRATLSLTVARALGRGRVIRYTGSNRGTR